MTARRRETFALVVSISILTDARGEPFRWVPCETTPLAWDEIAPIRIRRRAAEICIEQCPALTACAQARAELEAAGGIARGVWAGHVLTGRGVNEAVEPPSGSGSRRRRDTHLPDVDDVFRVVA